MYNNSQSGFCKHFDVNPYNTAIITIEPPFNNKLIENINIVGEDYHYNIQIVYVYDYNIETATYPSGRFVTRILSRFVGKFMSGEDCTEHYPSRLFDSHFANKATLCVQFQSNIDELMGFHGAPILDGSDIALLVFYIYKQMM